MQYYYDNTHQKFERHVVLVAPDIPWNTGNIGRTCLGAGANLHLIQPLGFSLENRDLKRAGLDYWHRVKLTVWDDFAGFMDKMMPRTIELALFTKNGFQPFWRLPSPDRLFLVFGSETKGLPGAILSTFKQATYHIPTTGDIRCLNLSTVVGIALYESLRPVNPFTHEHLL